MNTHSHNRKGVNRKTREEKALDRRIAFCVIAFLLFIFSIGALFGGFLCMVFTYTTADASNNNTPAVIETADTDVSGLHLELYDRPIQSGNRVLDVTLLRTMDELCNEYDVPLALALAVAEQESGFNPDAISMTDDYGLMQINKINFKWLRENGIEPLDHKGNIEAGIRILSDAIKKHGGYGIALMVYNCGEAGAKRLWKKGTYSTKYSRATLDLYYKWDKFIGGA